MGTDVEIFYVPSPNSFLIFDDLIDINSKIETETEKT